MSQTPASFPSLNPPFFSSSASCLPSQEGYPFTALSFFSSPPFCTSVPSTKTSLSRVCPPRIVTTAIKREALCDEPSIVVDSTNCTLKPSADDSVTLVFKSILRKGAEVASGIPVTFEAIKPSLVADFQGRVPEEWYRFGTSAVFVPLLQCEAACIEFESSTTKAVKVSRVTAQRTVEKTEKNDFFVLPDNKVLHEVNSSQITSVPKEAQHYQISIFSPKKLLKSPAKPSPPSSACASPERQKRRVLSPSVDEVPEKSSASAEKNASTLLKLVSGFLGEKLETKVIGGKDCKRCIEPQIVELSPEHLPAGVNVNKLQLHVQVLGKRKNSNSVAPDTVLGTIGSAPFSHVEDKWVASLDKLIVRYASHTNGELMLKFSLVEGNSKKVLSFIESATFETITVRGLAKRQRKRARSEDEDSSEEREPKQLRSSKASSPAKVESPLKQTPISDPYSADYWEQTPTSVMNVFVVDAELYQWITGEQVQSSISKETYLSHGVQWFELYEEPVPEQDEFVPCSILDVLTTGQPLPAPVESEIPCDDILASINDIAESTDYFGGDRFTLLDENMNNADCVQSFSSSLQMLENLDNSSLRWNSDKFLDMDSFL